MDSDKKDVSNHTGERSAPETPEADPMSAGSLVEVIAEIDGEMAAHPDWGTQIFSTEEPPPDGEGSERHLVFTVAGMKYTASIRNILELDRVPRITPVPNVPPWLYGVTNLRGDILSVIDFRSFLGLPPSELTGKGRMLVVRSIHDEIATGLIVDDVNGLYNMATREITPPTAPLEGKVTAFLRGIFISRQQFLIVLDFERFLSSPEIRQFGAS